MKLYELDFEVENCSDPETGEVDEVRLAALELERTQKQENIALWIKNEKADIEALKAEEKKLAERRKVKENRVDSLRRYLGLSLAGEKLNTARVAISWRKSKAVSIYDEAEIGEEFKHYEVKYDKKGIGEALKAGREVPGAELIENSNMIIK